jgi:hypothetical protein
MSNSKRDKISFPCSIAVIAPSGGGKTTFVKAFLRYYARQFQRIFILAGSCNFAEQYKDVKDIATVGQLHIDKIKGLIRNLRDASKKTSNLPNYCLVLDDFIGITNLNNKIIEYLATQVRHVKLSVIFLAQKVTSALPTTVRGNLSHVFIIGNSRSSNFEAFYDDVKTDIPNAKFWADMCQKRLASPYSFCHIDHQNFTDKSNHVLFFKGITNSNFSWNELKNEMRTVRRVVQDKMSDRSSSGFKVLREASGNRNESFRETGRTEEDYVSGSEDGEDYRIEDSGEDYLSEEDYYQEASETEGDEEERFFPKRF